ncbi:MAG: GDP-mannose 4,6-dehydratase [Candidatus Omnitrophica bacterium]|nr:GDP-mannose 4,6-dehydratase [Candidatus Omnitrophota bacterium]
MIKKCEKFYLKKKVLITGGLGFIGSTIARKLVEIGCEDITLIDSMIPQYGGNLFNIKGIEKKVKINFSDIRDAYSISYLVQNKDIIFNLAGTLSHVDSMKDPFTDLDINCRAQLTILEACRKYNPKVRIIFAGTRNQYGKAKYLPVDESHPMEPVDINGINNIAGEWYHILYNNIYGIKACSLRLTNCYGPRHQMKHPRQGVLNWFIRQVIDGEKIKLYGSGEQIRDCNYVDDVVTAFLMVGASNEVWGSAFNLGGTPVSLKKFVEEVIKIYGKGSYEIVPFPKERRIIEPGDYIADWRKIKKTVGWEPKVTLEEGIKKTIDFYKKYKNFYWQKGTFL